MKQKLLLITLLVLGYAGMAKAQTTVWSFDEGEFELPNDNFFFEVAPFERGMTGKVSIYYTSKDRVYRAMQFECTQASATGKIVKGIYSKAVDEQMEWGDPDVVGQPAGLQMNIGEKNEDGTNVPIYTFVLWNQQDVAFPQGEKIHLADIYFEVPEDAELGEHQLSVTHLEFSESDPNKTMPIHFCGNKTDIRPMDPMTITYEVVEKGAPRILDEEDTVEPADSYNGEEQNLIVKRTIKGGQWSTICLPFSIPAEDFEEAFGTTVTIAGDPTWEYDADANTIDMMFYSEGYDEISANTPMLIRTEGDVTEIKYTAAVTVDDPTTQFDNGLKGGKKRYGYFYGVYYKQQIPEKGVFLSGNKFWYSTGISNIKGYRAYFTLQDEIDFSSGVNIGVKIDGEATAVEGLTTSTRIDDNVYTVSGVNLGKNVDTKKLQPGIYIVNNKKVIVK